MDIICKLEKIFRLWICWFWGPWWCHEGTSLPPISRNISTVCKTTFGKWNVNYNIVGHFHMVWNFADRLGAAKIRTAKLKWMGRENVMSCINQLIDMDVVSTWGATKVKTMKISSEAQFHTNLLLLGCRPQTSEVDPPMPTFFGG